jgi:hypothetical protein
MVRALIEIYDSWKKRLDESGEEYYLRIWLFKNDFIQSQVVMARGEEIDSYENTFRASQEKKKLNNSAFEPVRDLLNRFDWEPMIYCAEYWEDDRDSFADDVEWNAHQRQIEVAKKKCLEIREHNGKKVFLVKDDDVWIGRARKP